MSHQTVEILEYSYEQKIKKLIEFNVNNGVVNNIILKQKCNFRVFYGFLSACKKIRMVFKTRLA